ncbi:MAG: hypothetical protein ACM3S1_04885 [Hyphomicrobiales bacterium]
MRPPLLALIAVALFAAVALPSVASGASPLGFFIASESYYRLDVPAGTMSARVEAEIQPDGQPLDEIMLWVMPGASNIVVKEGDTPLQTETFLDAVPDLGMPSAISVKLSQQLKGKNRTNLTLTYDVSSQKNDFASLEPGVIEAMFVSQGQGSFVFIDVPEAGDNYFEPGCLRGADQPGDVKDSGLVRWVCGDATLIAVNTDNKSVQEQCANLDDRCRQRLTPLPYAGFAQSVTDDAKKGLLEAEVPLQRGNVKVSLKYFKSDTEWAQREFALAQKALPMLEQTFNFPYAHDSIELRESRFIGLVGAAGIAFPAEGQVLVTHSGDLGFDDEVTVHELAHQWAGNNLETSWLWEGLAEYGMRTLAPTLGITPRDWGWESLGYTDPLATWWNGSQVLDANYWYGKTMTFWFKYQEAIGGPENMKQVLGMLDDRPEQLPVDGRWFMDAGERVSGANLDELFLTWVYNRQTSAPLFAERRAAHDLVKGLVSRAAELGLTGVPTDIQANLDEWQFGGVAGQVADANKVLDNYQRVVARSNDAGLGAPGGVAAAWGTSTIARSGAVVEDQDQAISAIVNATSSLANEEAGSPALARLAQARDAYAAGNFEEAARLASESTTTAYNEVAAGRMLELAREKQASYKPSFFGRIGLFFTDPEGDLAKAEQAYANGDPEAALKLSGSAYDAWDGANERGLMRLAILAGAMCGLTVGVWYLLRRLDPDRVSRPAGTGHVLTEESRASWRDWENTGGG